jgi:hypothetical protein
MEEDQCQILPVFRLEELVESRCMVLNLKVEVSFSNHATSIYMVHHIYLDFFFGRSPSSLFLLTI